MRAAAAKKRKRRRLSLLSLAGREREKEGRVQSPCSPLNSILLPPLLSPERVLCICGSRRKIARAARRRDRERKMIIGDSGRSSPPFLSCFIHFFYLFFSTDLVPCLEHGVPLRLDVMVLARHGDCECAFLRGGKSGWKRRRRRVKKKRESEQGRSRERERETKKLVEDFLTKSSLSRRRRKGRASIAASTPSLPLPRPPWPSISRRCSARRRTGST